MTPWFVYVCMSCMCFGRGGKSIPIRRAADDRDRAIQFVRSGQNTYMTYTHTQNPGEFSILWKPNRALRRWPTSPGLPRGGGATPERSSRPRANVPRHGASVTAVVGPRRNVDAVERQANPIDPSCRIASVLAHGASKRSSPFRGNRT